ncbi:hypothetical protein [Robiginitalea sediminis]|uniref:hypothetical protein n=1 Tax=Robiginitalea sediminis TaxID=1982593 RepID=UPI000B4C1526|nr:hypothetical protein [Robiginitalea sediminis]
MKPGWLIEYLWGEPFLAVYLLAVIFSLWKYRKYYDTPLRFLPVLLMYTLLTELMGMIIRDNAEYSLNLTEFYFNNNWLIFNIYNLIFFLYFLYVYRLYLQRDRWKKIAWAGTAVFVLTSGINALMEDFRIVSQLYSYTVGGLWMILLSGAYLYQQWKLRFQIPQRRNLLVWISLGILVFYTGYLPIKYLRFSIVTMDSDASLALLRTFHLGLIYFMYGSFLLGFLLLKRMKKPQGS